jgi:hypothetical protein
LSAKLLPLFFLSFFLSTLEEAAAEEETNKKISQLRKAEI